MIFVNFIEINGHENSSFWYRKVRMAFSQSMSPETTLFSLRVSEELGNKKRGNIKQNQKSSQF